jgi:hypothetical protein
MKTLNSINDPIHYPQFWNEEWLSAAIKELDTTAMTPEQRLIFEMTISANALAIKNENKKIQEAELQVKIATVTEMLRSGSLSDEDIAKYSLTSLEFVQKIKHQLLENE